MPIDDIFKDVLNSAVIVPEKKDFRSIRAIVGVVAGLLIGAGLAYINVTNSIVTSVGLSGIVGYFIGVILVELAFWIVFAALSAGCVALFLWFVGLF